MTALAWPAVVESAPELAARGAELLQGFTLGYLATLRRDGSPRVHPVTVTTEPTGLYIYAVSGTAKIQDLRRDPRYALHSYQQVVEDRFCDAEFSFGGYSVEIDDPALYEDIRRRHNDTVGPGDPMFRLDLTWAIHKRREHGRPVYLRWRLRE